ncbi:MAG TPA: M20/M25/M40 family metallo-hydrolase [Terriglobales bacterium]|nr:M20/M25/M40 family metallo-hydrolase [Terriglobales bacterium]
MRNPIALHLGIGILLISGARAQQGQKSDLEQVMTEALKPSLLETNLRHLTDEIGGRVPGTPAMREAIDWGVAAFKSAGADNVHTEEFNLPASWAEGVTQMNIVAPEQFPVRAISLAWAPALSPQHHVRVVDIGEGTAEDFARAGNIAGALLLVHSGEMKKWDDLFAEYLKAPPIIDLALKGKALAIAFQSTRPHDLLYRHTNAVSGEIDRLPMVLIAREDASRMARLLAYGQALYADLSIPNQIGGPIGVANVIAEIRGSEKPDEFVLLGAHLDSWELGTGALDNGCNATLVIDALRAIKASGLHPRRTIRFALFAGEEQGMIGSRAYVTSHKQELDRAVGVVVFDAGIGRVTGFSVGGRRDVVDATSQLIAPLKPWDASTLTTDAEWGTDNFDFMLEGVPTFVANQEEGNYLINYHASSDTFDKVDIQQLKKHVAEAAELTLALADTPQPIGPRLNRAQVEQTMRETHLDEQLKVFGIWQDWESGKRGRAQ